eukprot:4146792-Prorocentrum_lima.AAC.1
MGTQGPDTPSRSGSSALSGKVRDPPRKLVDKTSAENMSGSDQQDIKKEEVPPPSLSMNNANTTWDIVDL